MSPVTNLCVFVFSVVAEDHIDVMRTFFDKYEQYLLEPTSTTTKKITKKRQELYPDSGLYISPARLAAIHADARKDCLRLFHLLFDEFFSVEECSNAVAFGKHGKIPEGKKILDKSKVDGILSEYMFFPLIKLKIYALCSLFFVFCFSAYVMQCSTHNGWTAVEKAKVKKALINKCRSRAAKCE